MNNNCKMYYLTGPRL